MAQLMTFTFVCLADNQVATHVAVQHLEPGEVRQHAVQLLREHAAAATIEVWREDRVWEVIGRDGVRAIVDGRDRDAVDPTFDVDASAGIGSL